MRTVLAINNFHEFVLPRGVNVGALVKALTGAVKVDWDYETKGEQREYFVERPIEITVKQVPEHCFKLKPGETAPAEFEPRKLNGSRPRQLLLKQGGGR